MGSTKRHYGKKELALWDAENDSHHPKQEKLTIGSKKKNKESGKIHNGTQQVAQ
jgi:hypothetical protein